MACTKWILGGNMTLKNYNYRVYIDPDDLYDMITKGAGEAYQITEDEMADLSLLVEQQIRHFLERNHI